MDKADIARSRSKVVARTVGALVASASVALLPSTAFASTPLDSALGDINASRAASGSCPVVVDAVLQTEAQLWSTQMAQSNRLAHSAFGAAGGEAAENVGRAGSSAQTHQLFLSSSSHRKNLLDPRFDAVGIGIVGGGGNTWVTYRFADTNGAGC